MPISKEHVARIAELAGLDLPPEKLQKLTRDLTQIVAYVDRLEAIDTDGIEPVLPKQAVGMLREDAVRPSLTVDEALKNAPEKKDGYFIVPRVI